MVVKRGIALGNTLELVIKIDYNLAQGHCILQFHTVTTYILLLQQFSPLAQTQGHNRADKGGKRDDGGLDIGLLNVVDEGGIRHTGGIVYLLHLTMLVVHQIGHIGHRSDYVHVKLAVQTFLHNLHVEQSQEAASETKSQCHTAFGLEGEACIVELKLFKAGTEVFEILGLNGIHTRKDHRLHLLKSGNGLLTRARHMRDSVAHLHLGGVLDARNDIAHIAAPQFVAGNHVHLQHANLVCLVRLARVDEEHLISLAQGTIDNFEISDDAAERIEHAVKDKRLQWRFLISLGSRYAFYHGSQDVVHSLSRFTACPYDFLALASQQVHNLILHLLGHGIGHITLVYDGDNLQIVVDGHIKVADGLGLYSLRGIHHQKGALTGCNASAHLVRKVHMSRSINQIERVMLAIHFVCHLDGMTLDGDTSFALQVHVIEHLALGHLDGVGCFQKPVCQCALSMVDMCNDAEISYILHSRCCPYLLAKLQTLFGIFKFFYRKSRFLLYNWINHALQLSYNAQAEPWARFGGTQGSAENRCPP